MQDKAKLFFFLQTENLVFKHDETKKWVYIKAVSGGGRGQKIGTTAYPHGVNDSRLLTSLSEREKRVGSHRGGPLPHGVYKVDIPQMHNFSAPGQVPHMVRALPIRLTHTPTRCSTARKERGRNDKAKE
jgi:hypothetical protein